MFKITVYQDHKESILMASAGANLLHVLIKNGYYLTTFCGGSGICGKCRVKLIAQSGTTYECLACEFIVDSDLVIELPNSTEGQAQIVTSSSLDINLNPAIYKQTIKLSTPKLQDPLSDVERIERTASGLNQVPFELMAAVPSIMRNDDFTVTVTSYNHEIIAIESGDTAERKYAIAIDLGTTTIVGYLLDLHTGQQVGIYSSLNSQAVYGADVISRINYSLQVPDGLGQLTASIRAKINAMINYLCCKFQISCTHIYEVVLVANTVMGHIYAGLPVGNIAVAPFVPVVSRQLELSAKQVELDICPQAKVVLPPVVSGYVGSDIIAGILACDMHQSETINLLIDIGTNGEIVLGNRQEMVACATAAGPALEGAGIACGLGGVTGAINQVSIDDGQLTYQVIGGVEAQGICGSGVIDVLAQMLNAGIITNSGQFATSDECISKRLVLLEDQSVFMIDASLANPIYISQKDISEIQLAKAAIAAGIEVLLKQLQLTYNDINTVYLTGGFGNYMDHDSAVAIGLIPFALQDKLKSIGNGAGQGAKMMLINQDCLAQAQEIQTKIKYIELSAREDFQESYIDNLYFPSAIK